MRIKKIEASNIKGFSFSDNIGPATVFIGNNSTGKTSRLKAIELALLGHSPRLGKQPGTTFQLSSGERMSVAVEMDDGKLISRFWQKKGEKVTTGQTEGAPEIPVILLDAQEYFSLGATDRTRFIFNSVPMGDKFSRDQVQAAMMTAATINGDNTKEVSEEGVAALTEVSTTITKESSLISLGPTHSFIANMLKNFTQFAKDAKAAVVRLKQTAEGIGAVAGDEVPVSLSAAEAERQAAAEQMAIAQRDIGAIQSTIDNRAKHKATLDALTVKAGTPLANTADLEDNIATLKSTITALESRTSLTNAATTDLGAANTDLETTKHRYRDLKANLDRLTKEKVELAKAGCCPSCGAQGSGFTQLIAKKYDPQIKTATDELAAIAEKGRTFAATAAEIEKRVVAERQADEAAKITLNESRIRLVSLEKRLTDIKTANQSILTAKESLANMPDSATEELPDITVKQAVLEAHKTTHAAADMLVKRAVAQQTASVTKRKAQREAAVAKIKADMLGRVVAALADIQEQVAKFAFGSILTTVNRVTSSIIPDPLDYQDGEVGFMRNGSWVPYPLMAGSYEAVTFAAMGLALATTTKFKLFLLDEVTRLDSENKTKLAKRLVELVTDGTIEQCVMIDTDRRAYEGVEGLTIIETK